MSYITHFDDIPHIIRYGMHSETPEKCWVFFYRQGVRFIIDVNADDVRDTPFYEKWKPTLRKTGKHEDSSQAKFQRWFDFCDCDIPAAIGQLRLLAPVRPHWNTLQDYLHTPSYRLKLVKVDYFGVDIVAEITKGPEDIPAYGYELQDRHALDALPDSLPLFSSDYLAVLDHKRNWRAKPEKVRHTTCDFDATIYYFISCEKSVRSSTQGTITNPSMDLIKAYIQVLNHIEGKGQKWPAGLSKIQGVVIDSPMSSTELSEPRLAGILISWTGGRSL